MFKSYRNVIAILPVTIQVFPYLNIRN